MAKKRIYRPRMSTKDIRNKIKFFYMEKFFNKWMSKYEYPELNYQQKHYIMKKFWSEGTISCFSIKTSDKVLAGLINDKVLEYKEKEFIFAPWAFAYRYNVYDFPTHARPINTRGVAFIPNEALEIDKDIVIGYAQKNHKSVFSSIEAKVNELIDIEMKKRLARKAQAQPWLFAFSSEDFEQAKVLQEQMEADEPYMFVPFNEVDKVKSLSSGAPYIVDKLEQDRQKCEDDILTMLGCNNVGVGEKKEHLIVDEVNANNEDIEQQSYSFKSEIEDFFDRIEKVLGFKVHVIDMNEEFKEDEDYVDEKEDNKDESNFNE